MSSRCDPSQVPQKRKIMDSKFHLYLLLVILGSLTMQVHSKQGAACERVGVCFDQQVDCLPPSFDCFDYGFYCPGSQKCCCYED
ncbi:hypothetical protein ACROYT_G038498 [Oculina patagonica]